MKKVNNVKSNGWNGNDGGNQDGNQGNDQDGSNPSGNGNRQRQRREVPSWKYEREENQTTMKKDGKDYWWCDKHTNPKTGSKGMWARHKPEDHKDSFRQNSQSNSNGTTEGTGSTGTTDTNQSEASSSSNNPVPNVQVDRNLFNSLRTGADVQSFLDAVTNNNVSLNE